ncbi:sulfotransferase domain-containing protein [Nonomuraea typhae]|uniref:sulfotransferase domain-containing protein n=1 Tax=Nonomuraea typhae TaxID=2603600 RepID=UPI0012F85E72|nr:sulfotransferase domain-containing protein [Nonomuraea typhae]
MTPSPARDDRTCWLDFETRPDDIVISPPAKCGTTWLQQICALLVFAPGELPAPLADVSPWLDTPLIPQEDVRARLAAQRHRRIIKAHLPLDALPVREGVTYIVGARHPLDAAVSLYHHMDNLARKRLKLPALRAWLVSWIDEQVADPAGQPESLQGVLSHLTQAWLRREEPPVVLVHYADLSADLEGQMRRLADKLGIRIPEGWWPELVRKSTFTSMREDADRLAPRVSFKDRAAFFRTGRSGAGRESLTEEEWARYHARAAALAPADLLTWLHR